MRIAVFGGANLDVLGRPEGKLVLRDSCIGHVEMRPGGVGRNIAEQIARSGMECELFTAFGSDMTAEMLRRSCTDLGIDVSHAITAEGSSCVYLCVHDDTGDMMTAVNDMALTRYLSPDYARQVSEWINRCDVCVTDTNASEETLKALTETVKVPILLDTVSCVKAERTRDILPRLEAIKPNLMEARSMTGWETPRDCALALLMRGVKRVFISLGKDGLFYADTTEDGCLPVKEVMDASVTGAGDALCAALATGLAKGLTTSACAAYAMEQTHAYMMGKK